MLWIIVLILLVGSGFLMEATPPNSNDQNPQNICYHTPGIYEIKLVVSNSAGYSDTVKLQLL